MAESIKWLSVNLSFDTAAFEKGLKRVTRDLDKMSNNFKSVGTKLTTALTLPLGAGAAAAVKFSMDFGKAMGNVQSLIPGNTARVQQLKTAVQELAIQTGKSTADIADGLYNVISAFGDGADSMAILETSAKASRAGLATTTDALNLLSAVTKAYGDTSARAVNKVGDLAFKAVELGQTTFPELAQSIGRVTPLTKALGVSQEELFGVMATMTGVTGKAAEVSTQLRGALQALMAPTETTADLYAKMGIASGEALIQQKGLFGAIKTLTDAATASGVPLQKYIASIEGQTFALALTGAQAEAYRQKLKAVTFSQNALNSAYDAQTKGVGATAFTFEQLRSKVEVLAQRLGDQLAPAFSKILDQLGPLIDLAVKAVTNFANMDKAGQGLVIMIGALAVAIGPLTTAVGVFIKMLSKGMSTIKALAQVLNSTALKITAAIAATVALGLTFKWLGDNAEPVIQRLQIAFSKLSEKLINEVKQILYSIATLAADMGMDDTALKLVDLAQKLDDLRMAVPDESAVKPFVSFKDSVGQVVDDIVSMAKRAGEAVGNMFNAPQAAASTAGMDAQGGPRQVDIVKPLPSQLFPTRETKIALENAGKLKGSLKGLEETAVEFGQVVAQALQDTFVSLGTGLGNMISGVSDGMSFLDRMKLAVIDFAGQLGKLFIATALAAEAFQKTLFTNPYAALAAGIALVAASTAARNYMKKGVQAPALAEGGLAYGPTMALVGDNRNAGADPEVIAPLSKLKRYMNGGGGVIQNNIYMDGKLIYDGLQRYENNRNRTRG